MLFSVHCCSAVNVNVHILGAVGGGACSCICVFLYFIGGVLMQSLVQCWAVDVNVQLYIYQAMRRLYFYLYLHLCLYLYLYFHAFLSAIQLAWMWMYIYRAMGGGSIDRQYGYETRWNTLPFPGRKMWWWRYWFKQLNTAANKYFLLSWKAERMCQSAIC